MRILLVDDDPEILELVTQFLTLSTQHEIQPTASAKDALEAISSARAPFDCLLADIQMPSVDGIALAEMVRQTPGYQHTPIIMLTAMQDKEHLDRAFAAGATDYIAKPFEFPVLKQRLQAAQRLAVDKARASRAVPSVGDFRGMGDEPKGFALREAVTFPEVASALDYTEFENYLRQLLRSQAARVTAFAVKVDRVDRVYAAASTEKFRLLLRDTARAISDTFLTEDGVVSYRGDGIFLCLRETTRLSRRMAQQKALNQRFQTIQGDMGEIGPRLLLGDPVPLRRRTDADTLEALATAVENVESHAMAATDMFEVHGRLMKQQRFNDEQRRLEKRAFETLLRDPDTPPVDDAWAKRLFNRSRRGAQT